MTLQISGAAASPVRRRVRTALVVATLALVGGSPTACSGAGGTTCGEFNALDEAGKRDTMNDLITESDDDAVKDQLDAAEDKDAFLDEFVNTLVVPACEADGNDDTEVGDLIYEDA